MASNATAAATIATPRTVFIDVSPLRGVAAVGFRAVQSGRVDAGGGTFVWQLEYASRAAACCAVAPDLLMVGTTD